MEQNQKLLRNIERISKEKSINQKELTERLGLGKSALSTKYGRIKKGKTLTVESLCEIAKGLDVEPWELLK